MPTSRIPPFTLSSPTLPETSRPANSLLAIGWCEGNIPTMSSEESKDKLEKLIEDCKAQAAEIVRLGGEITRQGQANLDLADVSQKVIRFSPPSGLSYETLL